RQRRSHERLKRQGWTDALAGPASTRARDGHETDRSPDGRRPGQIEGRRRPASSGQPVGTARERIQDPRETQAERPFYHAGSPQKIIFSYGQIIEKRSVRSRASSRKNRQDEFVGREEAGEDLGPPFDGDAGFRRAHLHGAQRQNFYLRVRDGEHGRPQARRVFADPNL